MSQNLLAFSVLAALAVITPIAILGLSYVAGPARSRRVTDLTPYECGVKPYHSARGRFSVKFYLVAMLFIIFDVEAVFIYPWARVLRERAGTPEGWFLFWVMMIFLGVLTVGFVYEWGRGALEWDR
ncbi:MAG: NADH-quinone oxidoreductase subunit A [Acidobacteriota bacterium]|nr:MAG: NADH-quinone oxidoreductase subunit A [Acidobacteriota bacterium]